MKSITFSFLRRPLHVVIEQSKAYYSYKDVCTCIGLTNPNNVRTNLLKEFDANALEELTIERSGDKAPEQVLNELQLFFLMVRSHCKTAKPFRRWFYDEVAPEIRRAVIE